MPKLSHSQILPETTWAVPENFLPILKKSPLGQQAQSPTPLVLMLLEQATCWFTCRTCGSHMHLSRPTRSYDGAVQGTCLKTSSCTGKTHAKPQTENENEFHQWHR